MFEKDSQLTTIGESCFFGCGLESFTIPKSVEDIGPEAFRGCTHLFSLSVEKGIRPKSEWRYAFYDTGLSDDDLECLDSSEGSDYRYKW